MTPRRADPDRRPATPPEARVIRPAGRAAERQWNDAREAQPDVMAVVRERLRTRPLDRSDNPNRTHRLKPPLHEHQVDGVRLTQWQHKMTSSGRVWYAVDVVARTVWVTRVSLTAPRETH